jgi:hypothetical protein
MTGAVWPGTVNILAIRKGEVLPLPQTAELIRLSLERLLGSPVSLDDLWDRNRPAPELAAPPPQPALTPQPRQTRKEASTTQSILEFLRNLNPLTSIRKEIQHVTTVVDRLKTDVEALKQGYADMKSRVDAHLTELVATLDDLKAKLAAQAASPDTAALEALAGDVEQLTSDEKNFHAEFVTTPPPAIVEPAPETPVPTPGGETPSGS